MLERFATRRRYRQPQRLQRKRTRRQRVAQPVLVMDGERLGGFTSDRRRAAAQFEDRLPRGRRPLRNRRARRQRTASARSASARVTVGPDRQLTRHARMPHAPRAVSPARSYSCPSPSASRAVRGAAGPSSSSCAARAVSSASDSRSSRLCSSTRFERPRVAGAHVVEVARRNLESGHVPFALDARTASARALVRAGNVARPRPSSAPQPPRRMQHVHVRQPANGVAIRCIE